ncbi:DUF4369 domain-containing protein [Flavobacterium sp. DG1-102-2]|uniref:DUF4369 domain-containing protein n=1 Tax=Flavobacterium sp. DG1-102-2 TaxID=3081663 RepID=UPI002949E926|nr:DUF4369 domain-containing protein [Flavobacterium sp. DG1-102-2]MDV6169927.1 DUF4369 domain-containing protein [Flavobacterium sp. DG1-102-2]
MKKIILALFAITLFVSCQKEDHGDANLHITGNVKGLRQGKLYIQKVVDTALVAVDTIVINGKSEFESWVKIDSPEMLYLFLDRGQTNSVDNNLPFFAEPGEMKIETSNDEFFYKAKVTGSKNQKLYEDFLKIKSKFSNQNLDLVAKNMEATKNSNVQQLDSIAKASEHLIKRRYLYTANFALNNAKSEVAPYLALSEIPDINLRYLDTIQKSMSPKVAKSLYGKMLSKYIADRKKAETAEVK